MIITLIKKLKKRFPIFKSNPGLVTFFTVSIGIFMFGFLLFSFVYLLPTVETVKAEDSKQVVSTIPTISTTGPILEVHIANNGIVFLQGARVESVLGKIITVSTSWDSVKLQWIINTNESYYGSRHFGTDFLDSSGNRIVITDIQIGNIINISGILDKNSATPTVSADVVRTSR